MITEKIKCIQIFFANGQPCREEHTLNGIAHNENGPCYRSWYKNSGQLMHEEYRRHGKLHNENGPAHIAWHENGQIKSEQYYLDGKLHNAEGPQFRSWDSTGLLQDEEYCLYDVLHSKEDWEKAVRWEEKRKGCNPSGKTVTIDGKKYKLEPVE